MEENSFSKKLAIAWWAVVFGIVCFSIGNITKREHQATQPVIPKITITNVDGVVDTTYTYTFELLP